jgi:hypothetical protein
MSSFFLSSFCYNHTVLFIIGATEPSIISFISQEKLNKKGSYLQNNSNKPFDVAAVIELNAIKTTGARIDINLLRKQINHIVLDELKLSKLLISCFRLFNCWTLMQFAIQTLIIHLLFGMYNFLSNLSCPGPSSISFSFWYHYCLVF